MGRKSLKQVRQKEIIEAFYKVAKKEGLENTSLAKVAKEMGVNTSLVLHYFGSKDDLIKEFINFILNSYKSLYTGKNNNPQTGSRLTFIIDNLFSREWNERIDDGVFYSSFALIFRDIQIKSAFKDLHEYLRSLLAQAIEEANEMGETNVKDPKETADLIFILVEGAYYYLSLYENDTSYSDKLKKYQSVALDLLGTKN